MPIRTSVDDYMLPCINKKLFGIDCMGCGFQRAFSLLLKGDFIAAFQMYPAIYTLLLLGLFLIAGLFVKFKYSEKIKIGLVILNLLIIVVSYIIKINQ